MRESDQNPVPVAYRDVEGNTYRVMPGIGLRTYKARKNKPGSPSWKGVRQLEWRGAFEEAQSDLDALAQRNGWYPMDAVSG